MLEELRKEMHLLIEKYGLSDKRTLEKSQEIDEIVVKEQQQYTV